MTSLAALLFVSAVCLTFASGYRFHLKLSLTKDVTLEKGSRNYNYLPWLIVGWHIGFPRKRSLLQFKNPPSHCTKVVYARLYLYFVYAHKASFRSHADVPTFARTVVAHRVLKSWSETEATSTRRNSAENWSHKLLSLGSDAVPYPTSHGATIISGRSRWYAIDVSDAVRDWRNGQPNYGLLIRATNENRLGRDFHFASNRYRNHRKHAYIDVLCDSGSGNGRSKPVGPDGKIGPVGEIPAV